MAHSGPHHSGKRAKTHADMYTHTEGGKKNFHSNLVVSHQINHSVNKYICTWGSCFFPNVSFDLVSFPWTHKEWLDHFRQVSTRKRPFFWGGGHHPCYIKSLVLVEKKPLQTYISRPIWCHCGFSCWGSCQTACLENVLPSTGTYMKKDKSYFFLLWTYPLSLLNQ